MSIRSTKKKEQEATRTIYRQALANPIISQYPVPSQSHRQEILAALQAYLEKHLQGSRRKRAPFYHECMVVGVNSVTRSLENSISGCKAAAASRAGADVEESGERERESASNFMATQVQAQPERGSDAAAQMGERMDVSISAVAKHGIDSTAEARPDGSSSSKYNPLSLIFVCRPDLSTTRMVSHIPNMVGALNAMQGTTIYAVQLDHGAETVLADLVGFRSLSCLALRDNAPDLKGLVDVITQNGVANEAMRITAPWLVPFLVSPALSPTLQPAQIKHLQTVIPTDPRKRIRKRKEEKKKVKLESRRTRKIRLRLLKEESKNDLEKQAGDGMGTGGDEKNESIVMRGNEKGESVVLGSDKIDESAEMRVAP